MVSPKDLYQHVGQALILCVCFSGPHTLRMFFRILLYVNCFGRTVLYMCVEYRVYVNMYHVSAQGVDAGIMNVHYYY